MMTIIAQHVADRTPRILKNNQMTAQENPRVNNSKIVSISCLS